MIQTLIAFTVSFVVNLLVLRVARRRGHAPGHDLSGPQKFHHKPAPRIGGLGVLLGVAAGLMLCGLAALKATGQEEDLQEVWQMGWMLLACGLPAFGAGLIEDLAKKTSPSKSLLATVVSGLLAAWLLGALIRDTDTPGIDALVATTLGAYAFTLLVVAGIANSVNILDGFSGLASMCVVIMLCAVAYVAFRVDDPLVMNLALLGIGATLGFFIWNFPAGISLGHGGACFLGFWFAELSILLLVRNPGEVSPLFPLLVCIYPVFETVFSHFRRKVLRGPSVGSPDDMHLHSLIHHQVMHWTLADEDVRALKHRNFMTSPFLWLLCMLSAVPAVLFRDQGAPLAFFLLLFVATYLWLWWWTSTRFPTRPMETAASK
ncbi:MAG: glycosyltransferase [Betaproteobacteria bacterium]